MSPVVSTEDDKIAQVDRYTCRFIINHGKSVKVVGMSKQIDLIRNGPSKEAKLISDL